MTLCGSIREQKSLSDKPMPRLNWNVIGTIWNVI